MKSDYQSGMKIGILGGGQLGRMFIQEALNFDIHVHILEPDDKAPCAPIAHHFQKGDIKDFDTVYQFGKDKDVVTIEIEHVNVDALEQLEKDGVAVYPQPSVIRLIQDKGNQKLFYQEQNIPTAPFRIVPEHTNLEEHFDYLPYMQKARKGGYDGKGVQAIKSKEDFKSAFTSPSVLESFVDFEKELSVIVARNKNGETKTYPIVELEFNPEANLVEFLFAPANVSTAVAEKSSQIAIDIITKLDMIGILAVELFLTRSGEVLVNEIAPRPHNSGHQTIEANYTSQYEQHLRSIINLPLGSTAAIQPSVMVNLLGEPGHKGKAHYQGLEEILAIEGVFPHLYGKTNTKPFRKMGHVTITNGNLNNAKEIAFKVKDTLKVVAE